MKGALRYKWEVYWLASVAALLEGHVPGIGLVAGKALKTLNLLKLGSLDSAWSRGQRYSTGR